MLQNNIVCSVVLHLKFDYYNSVTEALFSKLGAHDSSVLQSLYSNR